MLDFKLALARLECRNSLWDVERQLACRERRSLALWTNIESCSSSKSSWPRECCPLRYKCDVFHRWHSCPRILELDSSHRTDATAKPKLFSLMMIV